MVEHPVEPRTIVAHPGAIQKLSEDLRFSLDFSPLTLVLATNAYPGNIIIDYLRYLKFYGKTTFWLSYAILEESLVIKHFLSLYALLHRWASASSSLHPVSQSGTKAFR